jgi:hypothetical protein
MCVDVMKGGRVTVAAYRAAALRACSASNVEQPWACVDLVYVLALLQDAYKLRDHDPVEVTTYHTISIPAYAI